MRDLRNHLGFVSDEITTGADRTINASREILDASRDVCSAKCDLIKETVELGEIGLNLAGAGGTISIERFVPRVGDDEDPFGTLRPPGFGPGDDPGPVIEPEFTPLRSGFTEVSEPFVSIAEAPPAAAPASTSSSADVEELREEVRQVHARLDQTNRRLDHIAGLLERAIENGVGVKLSPGDAGRIVRVGAESNGRARFS